MERRGVGGAAWTVKRMKHLFVLLTLLVAWSASAQPILRNSFTTNSTGKLPPTIPFDTNPLTPLMTRVKDGTNVNSVITAGNAFTTTGTNMAIAGNATANGADFTNSFKFQSGAGTGWVLRSIDANGTGQWTTNLDV